MHINSNRALPTYNIDIPGYSRKCAGITPGREGIPEKVPGECNLFARDLVLLMNSEKTRRRKI